MFAFLLLLITAILPAASPPLDPGHSANSSMQVSGAAASAPPAQASSQNSAPAASPINSPTSTPKPPAKTKKRKPQTTPRKVVVQDGGTTDPAVQFSTNSSPQQAASDRAKTTAMLNSITTNMEKLNPEKLTPSQKDMVGQIQSYVRQARAADDAGDSQGAHNLAVKATLLSKELDARPH